MTDLSRAYARGYNAGKKRQRGHIDRLVAIASAYRSRLRSTEQERFGSANWLSRTCSTCARSRGGEGYQWGWCGQNFVTEVGEPAMWLDDPRHYKIGTQADFGCVSWLHPENPLRPPFKSGR